MFGLPEFLQFDFSSLEALGRSIVSLVQNVCMFSMLALILHAIWVFVSKWILPFALVSNTEADGVDDVEEMRSKAKIKLEKVRAIFRFAFALIGFLLILLLWYRIGGMFL